MIIKPNRLSLITITIVKNLLAFLLIFTIFFLIPTIAYINNAIVVIATLTLFFILITYSIINTFFVYKKEKYSFDNDSLTINSGTLLSDSKYAIPIKNITFVDLEIPFIENLLFKTAKITIYSAGTGLTSKFTFKHLDNYIDNYNHLINLMKSNGFSLKQDKLIYKAIPDTIGIIINIYRKSSGVIFFLLFFSFIIFLFFTIGLKNVILGIFSIIISLLIAFIIIIIRYFDLKRRKYLVYEDSINYNKGFLTKHKSFIPVENLSDSSSTQTFIQNIFNIYDISISSKGLQTEVKFKNLKNGRDIENAIDSIVKNYQKNEIPIKDKDEVYIPTINKEEKIWTPSTFTTSLKMSFLPAIISSFITLLAGSLIFGVILFISSIDDSSSVNVNLLSSSIMAGLFLFGSLIWKIIEILSTNYHIKENSIVEDFNFLNTKRVEFNIKKVTSITIIRSIIDRLLGTCTFKFMSIGSSSALSFKSIKYDKELINNLIGKFSFKNNDKLLNSYTSNFNLKLFILSRIKGIIFTIILLGIIITALILFSNTLLVGVYNIFNYLILLILIILIFYPIIKYIYSIYYHKRTRLNIYEEKLTLKKGLITTYESYSRFENIKDIESTKWPLTNSGVLKISIGGEIIIESNSNKRNGMENYHFTNELRIEYVDDTVNKLFELERYITNSNSNSDIILETKPHLLSESLPFIIILTILFPLSPLIIIIILEILNKEFVIDNFRILRKSGIINKAYLSILFKKVDNINITKNIVNKMFDTATVTIETAGSSAPEMFLSNVKNYKEIEEILNNNTKLID